MLLCVALLLLKTSVSFCGVVNEETLILTHVIFRHGDRTPDPALTFPNDLHAHENYYPYGKGQLTQAGINGCYQFGKYLRKRYNTFLGQIFEQKILEATSSEYIRTRMSLQAVLAGLFPPAEPYIIDKEINWQPIPFKYLSYPDKLLAVHKSYEKLASIPKDFSTATAESRHLYEYVSEHSGWNITSMTQMAYVEDTIYTQEKMGLSHPKWVKEIWPEPLRSQLIEYWNAICHDEERRPYAGGNLINKILEDTVNKIAGSEHDKKIVLYSAHDLTVAGVLGNLKIYDGKHIGYIASVIVEIHRIKGSYFAMVLYRNYEEDDPVVLSLPGCKKLCPINEFLKLARIAMPKDA